MISKIVGVILFALGLGIVLLVLAESYNIYVEKDELPQLFKTEEFVVEEEEYESNGSIDEQIKNFIQDQTNKQLHEMLPAEAIARVLNLVSWGLFAGIAIFSGSKIAGLGISLMK